MRHANDSFDITETALQHLVAPDFCHITKTKQRMVRENDFDPQGSRMKDAFHSLGTQGSVGM
jgi:hypothetical protein